MNKYYFSPWTVLSSFLMHNKKDTDPDIIITLFSSIKKRFNDNRDFPISPTAMEIERR